VKLSRCSLHSKPQPLQILFLTGVTLTIGPKPTLKFFIRPRNHKVRTCLILLLGTVFFLGGLSLVFFGWPFVGMLIEGYGFFILFSAFFPTVLLFLKRTPVIGTILQMPGIKHAVTTIAGKGFEQTLPV